MFDLFPNRNLLNYIPLIKHPFFLYLSYILPTIIGYFFFMAIISFAYYTTFAIKCLQYSRVIYHNGLPYGKM